MASATATTDHDTIRRWAEERGGSPAVVADTADNERPGAILRIDFDDPGGDDDEGLERIEWDRFFEIFDASDLAFLRSEDDSRFNKFVARDSVEG